MAEKCVVCGNDENLKQGWTNCMYCSETCERQHVSECHGGMPGGKLPRKGWLPGCVDREISHRWCGYV